MALIKCPECGKEYSNLAEACPNCGCPTKVADPTKQPVTPMQAPKKRVNPYVDIEETEDGVIKKYKSLPSVPKVLTIIGMILVPLSVVRKLSTMGVFSMVNSLAGETVFNGGYYSDGELASMVLFAICSVVSMLGIYRLKKWGLYAFCVYMAVKLLVLMICSSAWCLGFSAILARMMWPIIYVCTLMFEEAGHNAFAILLNDGVIKEKKVVN
ncbi:MAG: hypothetical protein KBS70_08710 [Bacteroidales bacterium]|nr:hypothetical protein [Candidatus Colicola equi]